MKKKRGRSSRRGVTAEQITQEASVLRKARHDGVIYLHEVFETTPGFTLVMELWVFEILSIFIVTRPLFRRLSRLLNTHIKQFRVNIVYHDANIFPLLFFLIVFWNRDGKNFFATFSYFKPTVASWALFFLLFSFYKPRFCFIFRLFF